VVFKLHLDTETVGQMDVPPPLCVEPNVTVRSVLEQLKQEMRGCVVICRDSDLDAPIESVMTRNPATIAATDTVEAAIAKMSQGGYRRLPVLDGEGHPVGLFKVSAILRYLVQHFPKFVYNLPPHPEHTTQDREGA
jgi:CBS domain-containing protein